MNDAVLQVQERIPLEALSVYTFLTARSDLDLKVGLTQQEISRTTRLSVGAVREALGWLEQPSYLDSALKVATEIAPFISVKKYSTAYKITLLQPYSEERAIRFTFEDTDSRRIKLLEDEVRRLSKPVVQKSRLSMYLKGDKGSVIAEIESDLGRPITVEDAFLLGSILDGYGPERVRAAWRRHAANLPNPIRGIYAMFIKERFGVRTFEKEERIEEFDYPKFVRDKTIL
jgi:hypothetical protein